MGDSLNSVVEGSEEARRWMILTPGVQAPAKASSACCGSVTAPAPAAAAARVASDIEQKSVVVDVADRVDREIIEDVEMHCYDSWIESEGGGGEESGQSGDNRKTSRERKLQLSVVKHMAMLGCNAVLLIADTVQRFNDLQCSGACQKLLIGMPSGESGRQSGGQGSIVSPDMVEEGEEGVGDNADPSHLTAVNTILSTIAGEANQGVVSDSGVSSSQGEGGGGTVKFEASGGAFHSVFRSKRGVEGGKGQRNSEEVGEEIGNNGLRNRKNPLRIFAIRFWS